MTHSDPPRSCLVAKFTQSGDPSCQVSLQLRVTLITHEAALQDIQEEEASAARVGCVLCQGLGACMWKMMLGGLHKLKKRLMTSM